MKSDTEISLEWIRLELIPLPNYASKFKPMILWWNPEEGRLEGEIAVVLGIVNAAIEQGSISIVPTGSMEITQPLHKPSELAAILGQYFWVIPEPVAKPFELSFELDAKNTSDLLN
ncbi:MAG: hypothetical protein U9N57_12755 [Pseudomonadota bacterium]|nr:hypothetical protein [Pseudomonadota bacterium]